MNKLKSNRSFRVYSQHSCRLAFPPLSLSYYLLARGKMLHIYIHAVALNHRMLAVFIILLISSLFLGRQFIQRTQLRRNSEWWEWERCVVPPDMKNKLVCSVAFFHVTNFQVEAHFIAWLCVSWPSWSFLRQANAQINQQFVTSHKQPPDAKQSIILYSIQILIPSMY